MLMPSLLGAALLLASCAQKEQAVTPAIAADADIEAQTAKIVAGLTLEEKIGQMCQLTIGVLEDWGSKEEFKVNTEALDKLIDEYKVGSFLNTPRNVCQTLDKWQEIITTIQQKSIASLGIPTVYGVDQIHGGTYTLGATLFPQNINMAASFNRDLVRTSCEISAYETKAASIPWSFAPVLDLGRDARWSRQWENFGEDPLLNAEMGVEAIRGFQGDDPNHIGKYNVAACLKHYMGYGVPASGKDRTPSHITDSEMREKFFAPYLATLRAGALSVMVNSGNNNGVPFHASYKYLTQWIKEELNWDGVIVTDWADIANLFSRDHVAADKKDAIRMAINAGIDMSMDPYDADFCTLLKELVEEGKVPMSRIDDAVSRIIRMKIRLGLFDTPTWDKADYPKYGSEEFAAVALQAAEEAEVLLKNNAAVLPIAQGKKILVCGPNANTIRGLNGGWSYTWQGQQGDVIGERYNTILEAMRNEYGESAILYAEGSRYMGDQWDAEYGDESMLAEVTAKARQADVVMVCVGENSYCETPGNLNELDLPQCQQDIVRAAAKAGKPIVLVLNEGRPRIVRDIEPLCDAVIDIFLPGNYGGDALARLVSGKANFSAKMPISYPKYGQSLTTYDYKPCEQTDVMEGAYNYDAVVSQQWAFGYGISYTTFAYNNLTIDKGTFTANDSLTVSVDVTNTGAVAGKEPVLLFSSDLVATCTPDNRRLRAFDKVSLEPGETKTVTFHLPASALAFTDDYGQWVIEEGDFRFQAGNQTILTKCSETYRWTTPNI